MKKYDIHKYLRHLRIVRAAFMVLILGLSALIGYTIFEVYFNGPQLDQLILK